MRFNPLSEAECRPILVKGDYDAELIESKDHVSQANNQSIHLQWKVYDQKGRPFFVHDFLTSNEMFAYKLRHFCYNNGLENEYEGGHLSADVCRKVRNARLRINVKTDNEGMPKNNVTDYLPSDPLAPKKSADKAEGALEFNDDIPF